MRDMTRPLVLADDEIRARLLSLPSWTWTGGKLPRELRFRDFSEAFGFMARSALAAERLGHHPDWSNSFATVTIDLATHDQGGITELDFLLAAELERLLPA